MSLKPKIAQTCCASCNTTVIATCLRKYEHAVSSPHACAAAAGRAAAAPHATPAADALAAAPAVAILITMSYYCYCYHHHYYFVGSMCWCQPANPRKVFRSFPKLSPASAIGGLLSVVGLRLSKGSQMVTQWQAITDGHRVADNRRWRHRVASLPTIKEKQAGKDLPDDNDNTHDNETSHENKATKNNNHIKKGKVQLAKF